MNIDRHTDINFNGNPVYIIKEKETEKWRRYYYIDFSINNTDYGSWDNSIQLELPYGTTYSTNISNGSITFTKPDGSTISRSINKAISSIATSSSTTAYVYYFDKFNIANSGIISSDLNITGTITRKANYWTEFSSNVTSYGTVNQTGCAVEEGEVITISSNTLKVNKLNSDFSKTQITCTATIKSAYNDSTTTTDDKNETTGLWKKISKYSTYTPKFSEWSVSNGEIISGVSTITAKFYAVVTPHESSSIYGYAIKMTNNMGSTSYNGVTKVCLGQLYVLVKSSNPGTPSLSNSTANRQAVGTSYYWAQSGTNFYFGALSITPDGTNSSSSTIYPSYKIEVGLGDSTSGGYDSGSATMSKNASTSKGSYYETVQTLSRPYHLKLINGTGSNIIEASATRDFGKIKSNTSGSANWNKTLSRVNGHANITFTWAGSSFSKKIYDGAWSGSAVGGKGSAGYTMRLSSASYTTDSISFSLTKSGTSIKSYAAKCTASVYISHL